MNRNRTLTNCIVRGLLAAGLLLPTLCASLSLTAIAPARRARTCCARAIPGRGIQTVGLSGESVEVHVLPSMATAQPGAPGLSKPPDAAASSVVALMGAAFAEPIAVPAAPVWSQTSIPSAAPRGPPQG